MKKAIVLSSLQDLNNLVITKSDEEENKIVPPTGKKAVVVDVAESFRGVITRIERGTSKKDGAFYKYVIVQKVKTNETFLCNPGPSLKLFIGTEVSFVQDEKGHGVIEEVEVGQQTLEQVNNVIHLATKKMEIITKDQLVAIAAQYQDNTIDRLLELGRTPVGVLGNSLVLEVEE